MAARLPGAKNLNAFWDVLRQGRVTVSSHPSNRFSVERFLHPDQAVPGFSYTFAGGYLDDPFGFDAEAFGISAREAAQMDPQQRVLLEVVWEALEDAGIPPSRIAGERVGVYVGASNVDYQNSVAADQSAIESHFVTGIALSIISNRISCVFDWKGPSMTIDTACSSSMVALSKALEDLADDKVPLAVVAGVNMLLSPVPFIGFSHARMLSPTGLCRPFSADSDGYVRSEGAVALVLRKSDASHRNGHAERVRAEILGAGVNSDGRTVGVSLPSVEGQTALLQELYDRLEIDPAELAFVEAHGTGTAVGDPVEAEAIGRALGGRRREPLTIGSVKSNIGHLESASGVAGLAKAILSLQQGVYPRTLHLGATNPDISFDAWGLSPARDDTDLSALDGPIRAGVCNYGFGGTNAHVVIEAAPASDTQSPPRHEDRPTELYLSAQTRDGLRAVASNYAARISMAQDDVPGVVSAVHGQRDWLKERAVFRCETPQQLQADLNGFAQGDDRPALAAARGFAEAKVALIFSGNGCQWVGMGVDALSRHSAFADQIDDMDRHFRPLAGWSIRDMLGDPALAEKIAETSVAQPLIFAIQSALNAVLRDTGLEPVCILGHSVGEVAAAEACGALDRSQAVRLIFERSRHQELVRSRGGMVAVAAEAPQVEAIIADVAPALAIAALNGPSSTTISGDNDSLEAFAAAARNQRLATVRLDIDYPFHSPLLDEEHGVLLDALAFLKPRAPDIPFLSATDDAVVDGPGMDAEYWWRNIRRPVHFRSVVERAVELGANSFIEVSPRPILLNAVGDTAREKGANPVLLPTFDDVPGEDGIDPVRKICASLIVSGAMGRPSDLRVREAAPFRDLPLYPWQHQFCAIQHSGEAIRQMGSLLGQERHPLLGTRMADGSPEWRMVLDDRVVPYLADHKVGGETVVPGAALIEMVLSAATGIYGAVPVRIDDLDVFRALVIPENDMREVSVRFEKSRARVEIWSRRRFADEWTLHAASRIGPIEGSASAASAMTPDDLAGGDERTYSASEVYAATEHAGLNYGPSFRRIAELVTRDGAMTAIFAPGSLDAGAFDPASHVVDPSSLDAAFHGLFIDTPKAGRDGAQNAFLPVRVGRIAVWQPHAPIARADITLKRKTENARVADAVLRGPSGDVVAELHGVYLRRVTLARKETRSRIIRTDFPVVQSFSDGAGKTSDTPWMNTAPDVSSAPWQLSRALCLSVAQDVLSTHAPSGRLSLTDLRQMDGLQGARLSAALELLAQGGQAARDETGWSVGFDTELPASSVLLATLAERFPEAQADLLLGAQAVARAQTGSAAGDDAGTAAEPDAALRAAFSERSALFALVQRQAEDAIAKLQRQVSGRRPRLLVVDGWADGLHACLSEVLRSERVDLVVARSHEMIGDSAQRLARLSSGCRVVELDRLAGEELVPEIEAADAIVLGPVWSNVGQAVQTLSSALPLCGSRCRALLWDVPADSAVALMLALDDSGMERHGNRASHASVQARGLLRAEGFSFADTDAAGPLATLALGWRSVAARNTVSAQIQMLPGNPSCPVDDRLSAAIKALSGDGEPVFVDLPDAPGSGIAPAVRAERRATRLAGHLKLQARREEAVPLWIVTRGAFENGPSGGADADAIWRFARVAMNEYPEIDIRLVDLALDLSNRKSAELLAELLVNPGSEKELLIDRKAVRVPRMSTGSGPVSEALAPEYRARLKILPGQTFDHVSWESEQRRLPARSEIEIETQAVGLNFRDVMLGLGILDEDLLGHGLTSSALGFECVGKVVRLGEGVDDLAVGDLVMGFADDAFASHVTAPRSQFFAVPAGLPAASAATIPVAFSTAWYALNTVARLKEGETLLLHGAAGGVGMAAMQIARLAGARIVATAGTEAKRALVRALGADAVYDSRSTRFAEEINARYGGVDVVLNSLAGDQMWASLKTLKPFGRFVELGKRDFLENTPLDLRPFVRNRSYFGVDLDELLAHDPELVAGMVAEIGQAFDSGDLRPLPYGLFDGEDVSDAFRLMQRSGHVGKVVVRPATAVSVRAPSSSFVPASGVHLVIGGTSGFGFETALRLAERGAEKVVVASRQGMQDVALQQRLADYGDRIAIERVDATDARQVDALCDRVRAHHGPIAGVIHTAMVLEDGFIDGLTAESLHRVAAPKTLAADALHAATINDDLQYFVAYSSATTVIGSPGQAAYVLANGYLEGLMMERRRNGLPGLAVAWGAISDAGAISRDRDLGARLERTTGVTGVSAGEALDHLETLLARGSQTAPIETYTAMGDSAAAGKLAILSTPAFARLTLGQAQNAKGEAIDLAALMREKSEAEMFDTLVGMTIEEIAQILRMPPDTIDANEPLSIIGMDSLMGLELRLSFESRFGIELPLLSIGDLSVNVLSRKVLEELRKGEGPGDSGRDVAEALLSIHGADVENSAGAVSSATDES